MLNYIIYGICIYICVYIIQIYTYIDIILRDGRLIQPVMSGCIRLGLLTKLFDPPKDDGNLRVAHLALGSSPWPELKELLSDIKGLLPTPQIGGDNWLKKRMKSEKSIPFFHGLDRL